jgi:hypothetical protein
VTPAGSPITSTLTITTTAPTSSVLRSGIYWTGLMGLLTLASLLLLGMPGVSRVARGCCWLVLLVAFSLGGALIGCGGGSSSTGSGSGGSGSSTPSNPGTPAGTSTVTITATSGSTNETASLQVTVQ